MRAASAFCIGTAVGAGVAVLLVGLVLRREPVHSPATRVLNVSEQATVRRERSADTTLLPRRGPVSERRDVADTSAAPVHASDATEDPRVAATWEALVGGRLEQEAYLRVGERLSAERKARLLDALARLRDASLDLQQLPAAPDDPAGLRDRLSRTLVLLQTDQIFREELGMGVSEFLQGADPGAVEDVSARPEQD